MAEPIETLYIELQGRLDGLERSLKQAEQRLAQAGQDGGEAFSKGFGSGVEQVITKIGSIGAIVAGGAIGLGAFDGLVRSVFSLAQEADRANTQAQLLSATLERNGISATAAEQSFRATADALGVLPQQLNESSKLLINYGATLDQVAKLQEIGGASALAAGRSAAEGADLIAQAITTENSALLNGIGIASNLSTAYQNYGKEVGKTVEQLSAQEKAQAAVNYLLKETQSEVEALPTLLGGLAGQQSKLNNEFKQLQLTLGEALIPAVTGTIRVLNQLLDNLPTVISVATTLAAIIGAQRLAGSFAVLNLSVTQGASALAGWAATTVTTTTVTTALNGALNTLRTFFLTSPAVIIAAGAALITFAQQASSAIKAAEEAALASDRAFNKTESSRIAALRGSSNEIDQLKGRIAALQSALSSIQLGELGGNAEATAAKIKQLRGELAALQAEQAKQNTAQATSNDLFKEARTLVENLQKAQDSLSARQIFAAQQAIEEFTKANKDGSAVISAVRAAIAEQNAQLKENEKSTKAATKAVSEWDNYLKSERLEAYRRGLEVMTEAQLRQEVANQRSARAIEQLQAATARLNEIQTRRIELERQLAAQAANAPLEQSLAKLDRQYNLGTISAQQYLDAVNALLQAFSKQFASATKGSEEYDRLRGIILRLRDVQESLKDTLEETALAFQRQQASIPLQNTIQSLAESYKAAEITTTDYKNAIDSLLRSESTKFAALEKGTTAYDDQRQIILQLRDIQGELISQLEQETKVRSELQKTISDQANALRVLSESGRVDFLQGVAQQYVELQDLLDRNQVGDRAQQLAVDLNNALNSVQIDDATKKAIADLIAAFEELRGQIRIDDIQIPTQFNNFGNLTAEINAEIGTLNTELDTLSSQFKRNAISADEYTIAVNAIIEKFDALSQVARDQANSLQGIGDSAGAIEQLGVVEDIAVKVNELRKSLQNLSQTIKAEQFAPDIADVNLQEGIAALVQRVEELDRAYAKSGTGLEDVQSAIQATIPTLQGYIDLLEEERNLVESRGGKGSAEYEAAAKSIAIAESALASLNATAAKYVQTVEKIADLPIEEFSPAQVFQVAKRVVSELSAELEILTIRFRNGAISSQELQSASAATVARFEGIIAAVRALGDDLLKTGDSVGALERFQIADQAAKQIQQLRDAINETTGAIQKQQEVITIEDTVEALANAYANGTIAIEDYRQAIESLLNSERQQLLSLAKGTDGYNEQKQVVSDLTSVQEKIINLIKQEVEERDKLNKSLVAQAQNQRVLQEAGQEEFVNQIAKQFVELESLLKQNKISDRAYEIADNLQRAFNSVFIEDATRAAIKTLLEDFGALQKQLSQTADGLAIDVPLPRSFFELGNALQLINVALDANDELAKDSAASNQELASTYNEQARQLQDIRANLLAQLAAQRDSNASIDEQAITLRQIAESSRLIDRVSASIDKLRDSYDDASAASRLLQDAFEAAFDVPVIYANVGDSIAALRNQFGVLDSQLKRGSITNEQYSLGIQSLINLYGDLEQALIQQGDALQSAGDSAGALSQYNLAEQANQQIITLTQSLQKLQEVSARKFAPDLQVVDLEAGIAGIVEQTNALDAAFQKTGEDIFGTADAIRANINILEEWVQIRQEELNILEQQGNRGSDEYNKTAASLQRAQAELNKMRDVLDGYNRGIRELLTLDLPAEFNVLSSVITDAEQQLAALAIELGNGTISGEEYRQTLFAIATQIDSLVTALNEQRDAIQVVDEASQSAYGNLTTILQQASAALANTTEALRANAAAAIEAGRALRILQETSNEDVTQQVREGLRRLEELLSAGVINDEVLQLSDQLSELAGQTLPPDVRQWFERLMQDLSDVRGFINANIAETTTYSNANRDLANNIAKTVDALRRSGERIVTLQDALDAFKKYEIQVDTKQLEELRNFLFLTRTEFEDFVQASIDAAKDLPKLELINFSDGLANIGKSLESLQQVYQQTGERGDDYRQGLIDTIGDLQTFISVVGQLARQYSAAAEESDRALGAELTQLVEKARTRVEELSNQLNMLGVDVLVVDDLVQGFDRLDRTLARVQLPDILPDADLRNLLTAAGIDFGNFQQLGAALNNIPAPLRASSTLFGDFSDLVELSAQAQNRLAEAAGLALSQNQQLANQIRILAQELVVTGAISTDVALQYLELANQIGNTADNAKSGIDPFKALSSLTFQNFRELSISLDRIINPLTESGNAADLLQSALREAANAERLLSGAAAAVDNQFTRQAETIREYAAQLEKTGQVAPDLIARLRDLARALDIQAPLEEGRKKTEQLKNELLEAVDAFAGFGNLDIAGFDGLVSLSQGIAKLIGGDILGGIQSILAPYADLLEPILRPLGGAFSDLLDSLNPMISALGELLNSVITPLVQIASSVLLPVFEALGAAIKVISDGIKFLFDGLVSIYNATVGQLFGQIGDFTDASGLIQRIEDVVGKIGDAAKEAIIEMSRTVQETLASSFASALSDGIFEAISTGDLDTAKKALEERLKQIVVQVIIDTAVKAALATAAVSEVLKNLSDAIAYAIATGDWSGVGDAVTKAVSTVTGIMQQLSQQLTPVLGGLIPPPSQQPPGQGANPSLPNPFAAQQLPLSPQITVPLLDSAKLVGTAGTQISDASTALVEGLQGLELDSVASDMARSSRDFRAAVDDLGALLSNRTNWAGVNSR